ncbi:hypothetical protein Tsubulata_023809 [Turnera subulata]|uniref:F-box domain-containing protein n=1 Tax=Turnera subulata TaxID=218843 RepID=A0A9Q0G2C0_9ROSI|nr:hypothetical protein Tsubulata_023809 [Turnera subulata]
MSGDSNKRHKELVPCSSSSDSIPPPPSSIAAGTRSSPSSWFPPPSSDLSDFTVDDYMLVEVFCRLPSIQFLGQCKRVCKSWYRIISTHFLVRRFINHHININNSAAAHDGDDTKEEEEGNIVLGSSDYPNNPFLLIFGYTVSEEAFFRSEGHLILRVVFIEHAFRGDKNLCVDIYSSETGKWCAFPLVDVFHRGSRLKCSSNVVNWNGKLHWHSGEDIVAFDPFDPHKTYFIQDSPDLRENPDIFPPHCYLSVCRGFLRLMKIYIPYYRRGTVMMVWELKDGRSGNWSLEHNVNLDLLMNKKSTHISSFGLSCHPTDPNIVYFKENHDIIYCNLQTGAWEIVSQTPSNIDTNNSDIVFPVVLPPWPTPILPVPS